MSRNTASPSADSGFQSQPSTENRKRKLDLEVVHEHDGSFDKENEPPAKQPNLTGAQGTAGATASTSTERKARFNCFWGDCIYGCKTENDLYDHFLEIHLKVEQDRHPGEMGEEESLSCQWLRCKAVVTRGTWEKKVQFIEGHFHGRHSKRAQKFRCLMEDCTFRSTTKNMLENHIRSQHIAEKKEKKVVEEKDKWFRWRSRYYWPNWPGNGKFSIGRSMDMKIQNEMCTIRDMGGKCEMQSRPIELKGAARRKCRVRPNYVIVPSTSTKAAQSEDSGRQSEDSDEFDEVANSYQSLTLDDLFPGYQKERRGVFVVEENNFDNNSDDSAIAEVENIPQ